MAGEGKRKRKGVGGSGSGKGGEGGPARPEEGDRPGKAGSAGGEGSRKEFLRPGEMEKARREEVEGTGGKMTRRRFLKVAGATALGLGAAAALGGLAMNRGGDDEGGDDDDTLLYAPPEGGEWHAHLEGRPLRYEHFEPGRSAAAVWRGRPATVLHTGGLDLRGPAAFADYMFMEIIAFHTICPHLGCTVGARDGEGGGKQLFCVCHDSWFDPLNIVEDGNGSVKYLGAERKTGPANRALPLIPVILVSDVLAGDPRHWPEWYD